MAEATDQPSSASESSREEWLPAPIGRDGYWVSSRGRARGPRGLLSPTLDRRGYLKIGVNLDGTHRNLLMHQLVCAAFHGAKRDDRPQVRHLNGVKVDNRAANLAWGTHAENMADSGVHGTRAKGERVGGCVLTAGDVRSIRARLAAGEVGAHLANEYGVTKGAIYLIKLGKTWRHVI